MKKEYLARMFDIEGAEKVDILTLEHAFNYVHRGEFDVVLMRVEAQESVDFWWERQSELGLNRPEYYTGSRNKEITSSKPQRALGSECNARPKRYFNSARGVNSGLRQTPYYTFFERELNVKTLECDQDLEMRIASQCEYPPSTGKHFSFTPHANSNAYAHAGNCWPVKENCLQTAAFLTVESTTNTAGFRIWDYLPESRGELDEFIAMHEKDEGRALAFLQQFKSLEINPQEGDLCIFNCRKMHGIPSGNTLRKTIGSFFIKEDGWRIFN